MEPQENVPKTAHRLVGYARCSTDQQTLASQLDALHAQGCHAVFRDHGVSGGKSTRPGLDAMLKDLQPGDTVVVYKLDRLGRSVSHLSDLLDHFRSNDIHFRSVTEGIDTSTPGGKLVYHIFSAVAEFTRDLIRENTRAGLASARERGARVGRPRSLSDADVEFVRKSVLLDRASVASLAKRFQVSPTTIKRILASPSPLSGTEAL